MYNSLSEIKGIGPKIEGYFNTVGVYTPKDLLYYFPRDYEAYEKPIRISDVRIDTVVTVDAMIVTRPQLFRKNNLSITSVWLDDGTARIRAYWFNLPFINKTLILGKKCIFRGRVSSVRDGFALSQCKIYSYDNYKTFENKLTPIYPLVKGLKNTIVKNAIEDLCDDLDKNINGENYSNSFCEYLPEELLKERKLCKLQYALRHIHFPIDYDDMVNARKRLVYNEFFLFALANQYNRKNKLAKGREELIEVDEKKLDVLIDNLPYELTKSQKDAVKDIANDFKANKKLNRLVEGDVGSGKTIVAFLAAFLVADKKLQTAIMVPTEVLAEQHYSSLGELCYNILKLNDIKIALLTGSTKVSERKKILEDLKNGDIDIIVGTHALFSNDVVYKDLGLCIIDEQHRFGVSQRKALEEKSNNTNVIVMSATPIPRTLSMYLYANLDISKLTDKPKERKKIKNCVIEVKDREKGYKAIKKEIDLGHQAYVICAAIEKNDKDEVGSFVNYQNVNEYAEKLKLYFGKSINIGILHGKMKNDEKENVMRLFKDGKIDILVATTVVEVGVDVPNATFIMIEDAGAFGLAELHQLRGRVGRGKSQSYALFVDTMNTDKSKERLDVLYNSNDGFFIAEEDLRLRGAGDIFGVRQSGSMEFKIGDIYTDSEVFIAAGTDAKKYVDKIPKNTKIIIDEYLKNSSII